MIFEIIIGLLVILGIIFVPYMIGLIVSDKVSNVDIVWAHGTAAISLFVILMVISNVFGKIILSLVN